MVFLAGLVAVEWTCYKLADQGLANLLGLETLRHGTNLINFMGIKFLGGMPSQGQKSTGSTAGISQDNTKGKFYVFKDNEWNGFAAFSIFEKILVIGFIGKRLSPSIHKAYSGFNATLSYLHLPLPSRKWSKITNVFLNTLGVLGGLVTMAITPTLKFRVTPAEVSAKFQNDPCYGGLAYYTTHYVGMWKIGLIGTLTQGLNFDVFSRACHNPCKILTGIAQITAAVGLAALGMSAFPAASAWVIPIGAALIAFT
jgi:hypothetical protein